MTKLRPSWLHTQIADISSNTCFFTIALFVSNAGQKTHDIDNHIGKNTMNISGIPYQSHDYVTQYIIIY